MADLTLYRSDPSREVDGDDDDERALARERNVIIVPAPRSLIVGTRGAFRDYVRGQLETSAVGIVIDCARSEYIDSSGLGTLFSLAKDARRLGRGYCVARLPEDLRMLVALTRIDTMIQTSDALRSAILEVSVPVTPGEIDPSKVIELHPRPVRPPLRLEP